MDVTGTPCLQSSTTEKFPPILFWLILKLLHFFMASKRQRVQSLQIGDVNRFVSQEALDRYKQSVGGRKIIPERGFQAASTTEPTFAKIIADRGWETFVAQPKPAVVPIVREFYANAVVGYEEVYVRGIRVPFDSKTINSVYNLPDIANDDFSNLLESDINLEEVISTLCKPGATWKKFRGVEVSFPTSVMTKNSKTWMRFIWAKLMPSTHSIDVPKNRAILLYSILTEKSIDVGKVLYNSIVHSFRATTTIGLCLPSLICTLCMRAGVLWAPYEELQYPRRVIDRWMINRYKNDEITDTHPKAGPSAVPCSTPSEARPSTVPCSTPSKTTAIVERMMQIEARLDHLSNSLDQLITYIAGCNGIVVPTPNQFSSSFGMNNLQFSASLAQQQDCYPPENHEDLGFQPGNFDFPSFP